MANKVKLTNQQQQIFHIVAYFEGFKNLEKEALELHCKYKKSLPDWCFLEDDKFWGGMLKFNQYVMSKYIESVLECVWKITKKTYVINDETLEEIRNAPFPIDIPAEQFYRIPHWCTQVVFNNGKHLYKLMFTLLKGTPCLYLSHLDTTDVAKEVKYMPMIGIINTLSPAKRSSYTKVSDEALKELYDTYNLIGTGKIDQNKEEATEEIILALKICLYLSAERVDSNNNTVYFEKDYEKYKDGDEIFIADKETSIPLENIIVEKDISEVDISEFEEVIGGLHGTHKSPCTHYRRGYWKNQPCGEGRKDRKLVWIPPTIVNAHKK